VVKGENVSTDRELPPLPEPTLEDHDWELWGQNVRSDFYTREQVLAYRALIAEDCAKLCAQVGNIAVEMYGEGAECLQTAEMCVEAIRARYKAK
jgi:hypothetical protein